MIWRIFTVVIVATTLATACTSLNSNSSASKKIDTQKKLTETYTTQTSLSSYITYDNIQALVDAADLIIIGKTESNFEGSVPISIKEELQTKKEIKPNESVVVKDDKGFIRDSYTVTPVQVVRTLKGKTDAKVLNAIQAGAIVQEEGQPKRIIDSGDFTPLVQRSRYLLFLKQVDTATYPNLAGVYSIMSINQGKFNIDKTDAKEAAFADKSPQYKNLKAKALERFKKEIDIAQ